MSEVNVEGIGRDNVSYGTGSVREDATGKGRWDLIPFEPLMRLARWYEAGANKYADRNWEKGMPVSRCASAAARHLFKYVAGWKDEDHLAAVAWNVFAIMFYEARFVGKGEILDLPRHKEE